MSNAKLKGKQCSDAWFNSAAKKEALIGQATNTRFVKHSFDSEHPHDYGGRHEA